MCVGEFVSGSCVDTSAIGSCCLVYMQLPLQTEPSMPCDYCLIAKPSSVWPAHSRALREAAAALSVRCGSSGSSGHTSLRTSSLASSHERVAVGSA